MGTAFGIPYAGVSALFALGLLVLSLLLCGRGVRDLPGRALLSLTGHLRTRPDPWLECTLRAAFAEFDRELGLILKDRTHQVRAQPDGSHRRQFPRG